MIIGDINEMAEGGGFGGYYLDNSIGGGSYGYSGGMTSFINSIIHILENQFKESEN